jgi:hypothetical protein
LAINLIKLSDIYELRKKNVAYVKDEGSNLNTMIIALKLAVSCDVLVWKKVFMELVLVMHFLKHVNVHHYMKMFVRD